MPLVTLPRAMEMPPSIRHSVWGPLSTAQCAWRIPSLRQRSPSVGSRYQRSPCGMRLVLSAAAHPARCPLAQDIEPFAKPKVALEQYPTGAHLAARLLFTVRRRRFPVGFVVIWH